jgi:hypothetical protein
MVKYFYKKKRLSLVSPVTFSLGGIWVDRRAGFALPSLKKPCMQFSRTLRADALHCKTCALVNPAEKTIKILPKPSTDPLYHISAITVSSRDGRSCP